MRSWFRVDPGATFDKKVEAAGNEAFGAWTRAGAWSAGNLTDGFIPRSTAHKIATRRVWEKAIVAKLVEDGADGYRIHDYLEWNPSADEVRSKSAKRAAAGRLGGQAKAAHQETITPPVEPPEQEPEGAAPVANEQAIALAIATPIAQAIATADAQAIASSPACARSLSGSAVLGSSHSSSLEGSSDAHARDSERRANVDGIQEELFEGAAKPRRGVKRAIPAGWVPKPAAFALGRELGFSEERVRSEAARFVDGAKADGRLYVLWDPAFHNWLRIGKGNDLERAAKSKAAPGASRAPLWLPRGRKQQTGDATAR